MTEYVGRGYEHEVLETVVKSSLTGVAATVLAVAIASPAGLGGLVGTSLASGFGGDGNVAPADDPYANLPAFPAPLTAEELTQIRSQLARTSASLEITRAATEARMERIRAIAMTEGAASFAPVPDQTATADSGRGIVVASAPAPVLQPGLVPVGYTGGGSAEEYRSSHLDLADMMFAHETF